LKIGPVAHSRRRRLATSSPGLVHTCRHEATDPVHAYTRCTYLSTPQLGSVSAPLDSRKETCLFVTLSKHSRSTDRGSPRSVDSWFARLRRRSVVCVDEQYVERCDARRRVRTIRVRFVGYRVTKRSVWYRKADVKRTIVTRGTKRRTVLHAESLRAAARRIVGDRKR
jgi:hypothetical protein